jgi:SAM-dependent methyltransferase
MNPVEQLHELHFRDRRVRRLHRLFEGLIPPGSRILDVGCGDGALAAGLVASRPDLQLEGIDVVPREESRIPVTLFDGQRIPFPDASFDGLLFVDVVHHASDPAALFAEGVRVARDWILIKDHLREGLLAGATLRFMDRVGNSRFGVPLPYAYWTRARWERAFEEHGLERRSFRDRLGLYPFPLGLVFDRSLHFVALLGRRPAEGRAA